MQEETYEQAEDSDLAASSAIASDTVVAPPPAAEASCPTCAGNMALGASHVYAIGRIEARFPRLSVEKEFAQAAGRAETSPGRPTKRTSKRPGQTREPLSRPPAVLGVD